MKRLFSFLFIFIFSTSVFAQTQRQPQRVYVTPIVLSVTDFTTASEAKQIISNILDAVGLEGNYEVVPSTQVPNAAAATYKNKRYIAYNPAFVAAVAKVSGDNKWTTTAIFAHELGHHLYGHTDKHMASTPDIELQADAFAGYALRKMGATLDESQLAIKLIASRGGSATHPGRHDRLTWIEAGWLIADEQLANR
jgi:hypothetical protein